MAKKNSGYFKAIEYIGPRPQKPKKPNLLGGWIILMLSLGAAFLLGRNLVGSLLGAERKPTPNQLEEVISSLSSSPRFADRLAVAAIHYSSKEVTYDSFEYAIAYPNGDIFENRGTSADLIIRIYRKLGIDLQKEIHEDMGKNFRLYPQLWSATTTDPSKDHRRIPNLQRFFSNKGQTLSPSSEPSSYKSGDIVVWLFPDGQTHMGIVVPPAFKSEVEIPWVVHHPIDGKVKWEKALFQHQIIGHFRFAPE